MTQKQDPCDKCELIPRIEDLEKAFPDGPIPHREAHLAWMEAKKAEKEFWAQLKLDIVKNGIWSLIIIVVGLLVYAVLTKLGLPVE